MLLKYFKCFIKTNGSKPKLRRENTPYPTQSVIDVDEGTIDIISNFDNVDYEYLPNSSVLHIYKKE
jgi:hypothetical protein